MNPYRHLVNEYARFATEGKAYPLGGFTPPAPAKLPPGAPKALIFSPHPDDECIIGALALRLLREARMNVINVAVTQGSKTERKAGRLRGIGKRVPISRLWIDAVGARRAGQCHACVAETGPDRVGAGGESHRQNSGDERAAGHFHPARQ